MLHREFAIDNHLVLEGLWKQKGDRVIHPIVIFDILSFLSFLTAFVVLLKGWRNAFNLDIKLLLSCLLIFCLFYSFCLVLEWSGITKALDPFEDLGGALLPMWWAFTLYALFQQIAGHDLKESEERFRQVSESIEEVSWIGSERVNENETHMSIN